MKTNKKGVEMTKKKKMGIQLQPSIDKLTGKTGFIYEVKVDGVKIQDFIITDPHLDETGRFEVDAMEYYGLTEEQVREMEISNN